MPNFAGLPFISCLLNQGCQPTSAGNSPLAEETFTWHLTKLFVIDHFWIISILVVGIGFVSFLNLERGANPAVTSLKGVPYVVPIVLILLAVGTFVLNRTKFGRHVYAVGGNAEAARRAGIQVSRVRITVFMISSTFAGITASLNLPRPPNKLTPPTTAAAIAFKTIDLPAAASTDA